MSTQTDKMTELPRCLTELNGMLARAQHSRKWSADPNERDRYNHRATVILRRIQQVERQDAARRAIEPRPAELNESAGFFLAATVDRIADPHPRARSRAERARQIVLSRGVKLGHEPHTYLVTSQTDPQQRYQVRIPPRAPQSWSCYLYEPSHGGHTTDICPDIANNAPRFTHGKRCKHLFAAWMQSQLDQKGIPIIIPPTPLVPPLDHDYDHHDIQPGMYARTGYPAILIMSRVDYESRTAKVFADKVILPDRASFEDRSAMYHQMGILRNPFNGSGGDYSIFSCYHPDAATAIKLRTADLDLQLGNIQPMDWYEITGQQPIVDFDRVQDLIDLDRQSQKGESDV